MGRKKLVSPAEEPKDIQEVSSEKTHLLALYKELKDRGINSIGDLENKIARCE